MTKSFSRSVFAYCVNEFGKYKKIRKIKTIVRFHLKVAGSSPAPATKIAYGKDKSEE